MGWVILAMMIAFTALALALIGRLPRSTWEVVGAALLVGCAGYAWQGHPEMVGSPRSTQTQLVPFDEDLVMMRRTLGERFGKSAPWLTMSDGFARQGKTQDAANILISGLRANPDNADLWVGMGNALVAHGGGIVSPSAKYSYNRAADAAPDAISPLFFHGMALARSGDLEPARKIWSTLLPHVPIANPLHQQLAVNIAMIDKAIAQAAANLPNDEAP